MSRTRIKFCGITRVEDAEAAARAGADAIGLVFCESSPRRISIDQAKKIVATLPPWVSAVGLFVDSSVEKVREIATEVGFRHVQLHGRETPAIANELNEFIVLKALQVRAEELPATLSNWKNARVKGLLLDTAHPTLAGGSGEVNDWDAIATAQKAGTFRDLPPIILAGGLTPENVGSAVRQLRPFAVDVSSGIEISKGIKSAEKMRAFAQAVHEADAGGFGS